MPGHLHTAPSFCRAHGDVTHGGRGISVCEDVSSSGLLSGLLFGFRVLFLYQHVTVPDRNSEDDTRTWSMCHVCYHRWHKIVLLEVSVSLSLAGLLCKTDKPDEKNKSDLNG